MLQVRVSLGAGWKVESARPWISQPSGGSVERPMLQVVIPEAGSGSTDLAGAVVDA